MKKSKLGLFCLLVIILSILLASCDNFFVPETKEEVLQNFDNPITVDNLE